jgi:alpha-tubulin suppressor-like RCC1 family protein
MRRGWWVGVCGSLSVFGAACGFGVPASSAVAGDDVVIDASPEAGEADAPDAPGTVAQRCHLALGSDHSCVLRDTDHTVWCWGDHTYGELGAGTLNTTYSTAALQVPLGGMTTSVASKSYHACARIADGTVQCWGMNDAMQIGDGATGTHFSAANVAGLGDVVEVGVGRSYGCARRSAGDITCWGANTSGQLGDGTVVAKSTPSTTVTGLTATPIALYVASSHACALFPGGVGRCWGSNVFRQLGDGTTTDRSAAVAMPVTQIAQIAPSGYTVGQYSGGATCALRTDGSVWCWGSNDFGQLGTGNTTTTPTSTAVQVAGLTGVVELVAGRYHACARRQDGGVACWGRNDGGQIGDGTYNNRPAPFAVPLPRPALHVAAGGYHTCALLDDYALYCWGYNSTGQIGDGSFLTRTSPVASHTLCQ